MATNPFTLRVIAPDSPFCDRAEELKDLSRHAVNQAAVVLFSPRRYGKTSLVKKVQHEIGEKGALTFYADLFMVASVNEVAERIAKSVYTVLHKKESLPFSTTASGTELLDNVLEDLGAFIDEQRAEVHFVLDEFQEITELKGASIEGILRNHIQHHKASYFFVGSRRRVLLDIFNQRNRPFYQSAIIYPINLLPHDELVPFLAKLFEKEGKKCPESVAEMISHRTHQYPYYAQALAYNVFDISGKVIRGEDVDAGFERLLSSERYAYEAMVQGLTGAQIALLRALAASPSSHILSSEYLARHKLTVGGVQYARKKLVELDLIEEHNDIWRVVDPVFAQWLSTY